MENTQAQNRAIHGALTKKDQKRITGSILKNVEGAKEVKQTAYHPDVSKGETYIPYAHPDSVKHIAAQKKQKRIDRYAKGAGF